MPRFRWRSVWAWGSIPDKRPSLGVALALVAVMLVGREATVDGGTPYRFTPKVAWLTVLAGSAMGLNLVFLHQAPHACKLWPLVFARLYATLVVVVMAAMSNNLRMPGGRPRKLAVTLALLDICANVTYAGGAAHLVAVTGEHPDTRCIRRRRSYWRWWCCASGSAAGRGSAW